MIPREWNFSNRDPIFHDRIRLEILLRRKKLKTWIDSLLLQYIDFSIGQTELFIAFFILFLFRESIDRSILE